MSFKRALKNWIFEFLPCFFVPHHWKVNFVKNAGSTKLCWIYWSRYQDLKWMVQDSTWRSFSILVFMMFWRVVFSRNRNDYSSTKNVVFRFYFVLRALVVKMFRESYEVFVYQIVVPYKNAADFITKYDTRVLPTWQAHNPRRSKRSVTSVARNTSSSFIFVFVSLDTRDQQWFRCRCRCRHRSKLLQMFICCLFVVVVVLCCYVIRSTTCSFLHRRGPILHSFFPLLKVFACIL